jgi:hypothetical protein
VLTIATGGATVATQSWPVGFAAYSVAEKIFARADAGVLRGREGWSRGMLNDGRGGRCLDGALQYMMARSNI